MPSVIRMFLERKKFGKHIPIPTAPNRIVVDSFTVSINGLNTGVIS